jgi:rhamnosyltransferase
MDSNQLPNIAILLAVYNGERWLQEQVASIGSQQNVKVTIFVNVDQSQDNSERLITELSSVDSRIQILPLGNCFGSAAKNFYHLITEVDTSSFDYVCYSDQDDIWNPDKLSRHVDLIKQHHAEAVSSDVIAFWPDGRQKLIVKSQPQRIYDFLFESAGPGCTFLMTPWLVDAVKQQLLNNEAAKEVALHDWLTYAICRAHNKLWVIDPQPSMRYRQHLANEVGANSGVKAALARFKKIHSGWYRHQVALISRVALSINPDRNLNIFEKRIQSHSLLDQFKLIPFAFQGRRRLRDRLILTLSILFFVF